MNEIRKNPLNSLGYNFIRETSLPAGKNEYYLREEQNNNGIHYRQLSAYEIEVLVRNRNTSDNWNNILVSDAFNPERVHNCKFYGLVRIGKLESFYLEFKNLRRPVGLYNSTIISCDFGDNIVIDNVNYISHYIVGNEVIIVNVNELATTDYAKFGNGIVKEGEKESIRIWLEVCNENGGRKIIPFDGMLPGDAYLWTRDRDNRELQSRLKEFTIARFDSRRGYYGVVGDRTVIKNCKILKDVNIGSDAYLKGANKLKNLTINSSPEATSQIGEGCELVNGIIDYGCRIFYGVKAVRFFMASHSQLKYGARLINSYLGNNSTISCCEVLNSLIFPSHEQHHNNSFLCAALLAGQTNMAAGATIGSNHNSRSPDGELIAGRGFWPGLCVSLKHNSKFASFAIVAKGDYPAELNIPLPFSLITNNVKDDCITVMPGYWFMYNMYALARNSWKYSDRDKRINKVQHIEFDYLAPDTINEIYQALSIMEELTGDAWKRKYNGQSSQESSIEIGKRLLMSGDASLKDLSIVAYGYENSQRPANIVKVSACYQLFREMIAYNAARLIVDRLSKTDGAGIASFQSTLKQDFLINDWTNVGGQLIPTSEIDALKSRIISGSVGNWDEVHDFYREHAAKYEDQRLLHALAVVKEVHGLDVSNCSTAEVNDLIQKSVATKEWMVNKILESREKDYKNPFRLMVYNNPKEMDEVIGSLQDNAFIAYEKQQLARYKQAVADISTTVA
jgi:hypothetical protein